MKRMMLAIGSATAIAVGLVLTLASGRSPSPAPERSAALAPAPLSAAQARALIAQGALVADVREPEELAETGRLEGAVNVPLTRIARLAAAGSVPAELEAARGRALILYCRSGRRSREAGEILLRQGFARVYNLGGFEDAVKAGLPAS